MIFVVLGTQKFQLNRLTEELDRLVADGSITEEVVAQIGNSDYEPVNYRYERFLDKSEFDRNVARADVLITHSGVGSIITGLNAEKPVIVYPRLAKYGEHVDDHQLDIARAFEKKKYVLCCYDNDKLIDIIEKSKTYEFDKYVSQTEKIVGIVSDFLDRA